MRFMLYLALLCLLFISVPSADASNNGNVVVLSNGQVVVLPTNNDYFGNQVFFNNSIQVNRFGIRVDDFRFRRNDIRILEIDRRRRFLDIDINFRRR